MILISIIVINWSESDVIVFNDHSGIMVFIQMPLGLLLGLFLLKWT